MPKLHRLVLGSGKPPLHPFHDNFVDDTYVLVDKHVKHPMVRNMDVADLDFPDSSCEELYASHVLEHVDTPVKVLFEWNRVLVPGGRLRIFVPDFVWACEYFLRLHYNPDDVDPRCDPYYTNCEDVLKIFYGSQLRAGEYHYTGFSSKSIEFYLERTGFKVVKVNNSFESHHMQSIYAEAFAKKVGHL